MDNLVVENVRSRSRPNTPFLRSHCDHENCLEGDDHVHVHTKTGRKTPVPSRDTPTKIVPIITVEDIIEEPETEVFTSPPAHRTRNALKTKEVIDPITITSDYSSEEFDYSSDPKDMYLSKEASQNLTNSSYERYERITTTTSNSYKNGSGFVTSPDRLSRNSVSGGRQYQASPSDSERSNESFAESVLADSCRMSVSGTEHLPSRLYRDAIEYWNKYPKTDYTYSRLSRDRVELAPGQVAVPNMSRQSLGNYRSNSSEENISDAMSSLRREIDLGDAGYSSIRRRNWSSNAGANRHYNVPDTDWDEIDSQIISGSSSSAAKHWWITTLLITMWTTVVTTTTTLKNKVFRRDSAHRYPYYSANSYGFREKKKSWYTTVTESVKNRKWWILLLLLLLLPFLLITIKPEYKEKLQSLEYPSLPAFVVPDFSDLSLSLPEFSIKLPEISMPDFKMPNISMPEFKMPNISMPFELSLPDMSMPESFHEYKSAAGNKLFDFVDYVKIVFRACLKAAYQVWEGLLDMF